MYKDYFIHNSCQLKDKHFVSGWIVKDFTLALFWIFATVNYIKSEIYVAHMETNNYITD